MFHRRTQCRFGYLWDDYERRLPKARPTTLDLTLEFLYQAYWVVEGQRIELSSGQFRYYTRVPAFAGYLVPLIRVEGLSEVQNWRRRAWHTGGAAMWGLTFDMSGRLKRSLRLSARWRG